jgi:hypothetical protein
MERETAPGPISNVDHALLRAAKVWGGESPPELWAHFPADRSSSLRWALRSGLAGEPGTALDRLRREHVAQARPDLSRVHVSWWVRALKQETCSVRRAVAANLPAGIAEALREGLGLSPDEVRPERPAQAGAIAVSLSLWTGPLVGDLAEREDDPPAVVALTRFDASTVARLFQTTGLAKWAITDVLPPGLDHKDRERLTALRSLRAEIDPRFLPVANRDVAALGPTEPRAVARAGMTSFARLLLAPEPYRVRWALQHLPYATARSLRNMMGTDGRKSPLLVRWETEVLRSSWDLLHDEGRLPFPWGAPT